MSFVMPLLGTVLGSTLLLALGAALVLALIDRRRPRTGPLLAAAILLALALIAVSILPIAVPLPLGVALAVLAVAVAVLGGDPATRRVLAFTSDDTVREGPHGGILLRPASAAAAGAAPPEVLRGGATIGYLERAAVALAIIAGYGQAIAVVVALKGIGRFPELKSPEARERFIIGTLASLVWACVAAAVARLAIA